MLALFALGVMSLFWMAVVAAAILVEKALPGGERVRARACGRPLRAGHLGRRLARERAGARTSRRRCEMEMQP